MASLTGETLLLTVVMVEEKVSMTSDGVFRWRNFVIFVGTCFVEGTILITSDIAYKWRNFVFNVVVCRK